MEEEIRKSIMEYTNEEIIVAAKKIGRLSVVSELQDWFIEHHEDTYIDFRKEFLLKLKKLSEE